MTYAKCSLTSLLQRYLLLMMVLSRILTLARMKSVLLVILFLILRCLREAKAVKKHLVVVVLLILQALMNQNLLKQPWPQLTNLCKQIWHLKLVDRNLFLLLQSELLLSRTKLISIKFMVLETTAEWQETILECSWVEVHSHLMLSNNRHLLMMVSKFPEVHLLLESLRKIRLRRFQVCVRLWPRQWLRHWACHSLLTQMRWMPLTWLHYAKRSNALIILLLCFLSSSRLALLQWLSTPSLTHTLMVK